MPKYVIERNMPGAGAMSKDELAIIAERSVRALEQLAPNIQWLESYVTADRVYSVYIARHERLIREHAFLSGFPADRISEVTAVVDPSTAMEAAYAEQHDTAKEAGMY